MQHISATINHYINLWEECSECHFMVLPKMISSRFITNKIRCKDCQKANDNS